jgi:hypothetical protein
MAKTYDFKLVKLIVGGFLLEGFEKGSSIEVERYEDAFTFKVGADGKTVRSRNANRSGHIDITLQQGSPSNAVLSNLATLDEGTTGLPVPVLLNDGNAAALTPGIAVSKAGWVKKKPKQSFEAEATGLKWVIDVEDVDQFIGSYA